MEKMTLREIFRTYGITRRAIQGYEKNGLIAPSGMDGSSLIYYEEVVNRIREIKFYQELGFKIKEIKHILDADNDAKKTALKTKSDELEDEIKRLTNLIRQVEDKIEEL